MKPKDYIKLENDRSFKKKYINNTHWWKSILLIAPICFLFAGLVGILYLFNHDMMVSFYIIPYLLLFIIGTIWLKAIKRHIQKTMMNTQGSFHICIAKPIGEKGGYTYIAFVNDTHRHDKNYINHQTKDIALESFLEKHQEPFKTKSVLIREGDTDMYIKAFLSKDISNKNVSWREDGCFPILYISDKYIFVIKKKDLVTL